MTNADPKNPRIENPETIFNRKTAVLTIHGIGQQKPLETIDEFSRGLIKTFNESEHNFLKNNFFVRHHIKPNIKSTDGVRNLIRFADIKKEKPGYIDVFEFYWANLTEKKASLTDIQNWLRRTAAGSRKSFRFIQQKIQAEKNLMMKSENQAMQEGQYVMRMAKDKMEVKEMYRDSEQYLFKLTALLNRWLWLQIWSKKIFEYIKRNLPGFGALGVIIEPVFERLLMMSNTFIMDYMGDVTVYTTIDDKSEHYNIRQKILNGAVDNIISLLEDDDYEQVIVAGHSLGSVIAYNAMSRISLLINLPQNEKLRELARQKLKGLITFGSPLDKIYFFFREMSAEQDYVRRQIVAHSYSFKASSAYKEDIQDLMAQNAHALMLESEVNPQILDEVIWLNFHHQNDPVSGHLDFYEGLENIECIFENAPDNRWGFNAHLGYWLHNPMYVELLNKILNK
jgi:pimeloyl-ACP methyl ester carboxylesterase